MDYLLDVLKIAEKRKSIIIGRNGAIKRWIEKNTGTKIKINDEIEIEGDALGVMKASNIIKAIGRGFSPEIAKKLLDDENTLIIVPISKEKKELRRIKARLIGSGGKVRKNLETLTGVNISIYGKTCSIIANYENANLAMKAVEKLIKGSSHRYVYKFLEEYISKQRRCSCGTKKKDS